MRSFFFSVLGAALAGQAHASFSASTAVRATVLPLTQVQPSCQTTCMDLQASLNLPTCAGHTRCLCNAFISQRLMLCLECELGGVPDAAVQTALNEYGKACAETGFNVTGLVL